MTLRAHLTPITQIDQRLLNAWTDLSARALEPNPFFEPMVVCALARHVGLDICILTVERGSELALCLPLLRRTRWWHGLNLPTWRTWNPLGTPLVDARDAEASLGTALAHLAAATGPRALIIDLLPSDGPIAQALDSATADAYSDRWSESWQTSRPALRRRSDESYLCATLKGKTKGTFGRKRRALESLLGEPLRVIDESGSGAAVERLLSIEAGGWKGRSGFAVACRPDRAAYFRDVCAQFADLGRLQLLSLRSADATVAMKCDLRAGGITFNLRTTYDERFAKASPGVQLEIAAVGVFHANGDRMADSCTNHANNPQDWLWPDKRPLTRFSMVAVSGAGRVQDYDRKRFSG